VPFYRPCDRIGTDGPVLADRCTDKSLRLELEPLLYQQIDSDQIKQSQVLMVIFLGSFAAVCFVAA